MSDHDEFEVDEDEMSINCIGDEVDLVILRLAIERPATKDQPASILPKGTVLYLVEKRPDGHCRVANALGADPFLVPTASLTFEPPRSR